MKSPGVGGFIPFERGEELIQGFISRPKKAGEKKDPPPGGENLRGGNAYRFLKGGGEKNPRPKLGRRAKKNGKRNSPF